MVTINKHGHYANAKIDFHCGVCGCDFTADSKDFHIDADDFGKIYCSKCPECGYDICTTRNGVYVHYNFE